MKNKQNLPNILVCSVNSWNSRVGDNTFESLLRGYPKDKLAVLCLRSDLPDSTVCDNFFCISEERIIKNLFHPQIKTGYQLSADTSTDESKEKIVALYNRKKNFYYPKLFARELLWKIGRWNSEEFNDFLNTFKPDIVLFEMGRYIHLSRIIVYILSTFKQAKGVGCFWDDAFTYKQEKCIGYYLLRFWQRCSLKHLCRKTSQFFSITPKTKKEADEFFGVDSVILTKPVLQISREKLVRDISHCKILYTGNLGIGRYETLLEVVNIIKNSSYFRLDIYTNTYLSQKQRELLESSNTVLHEPVPQSVAIRLQQEADVLLFLEDLSDNNKVARLSFSTKITDYYSAGKCILAVGNKDLAPIELLKERNTAIVVERLEELAEKIELLRDSQIIEKYAEAAFNEGQKEHNPELISRIFYSTLINAYKEI